MRISISAIGLLALVTACAQTPAPPSKAPAALPARPTATAPPLDVGREAVLLRAALGREVPHAVVDPPATEREWIDRSRAALAASGQRIAAPQLVVVVDRNPSVQEMRIVMARPEGDWQDLGGAKVSTGETGRFDHY